MVQRHTIHLLIFLLIGGLFSTIFAKGRKHKDISKAQRIGPEQVTEFDRHVDQLISQGFEFIKPTPMPQTLTDNVVREVHVDTLGKTTYDFAWNNVAGTQIRHAFDSFDGVHMTYMWRTTDANSSRYATYNYYARQVEVFFAIEPGYYPTTQAGSGWPRVANGAASEGLYVYHYNSGTTGTRFRRDDVAGNATFTTEVVVDAAGLWPGIDTHGTTVVVSTTDDATRTMGRAYVSSDHGDTWTLIGWPSLILPNMTEWSNAETQPLIDPSGTSVSFVNMEDDITVSGSSAAENGGIVLSQSEDLSANTNWNSTLIYEFKDLLPDNSFYDPYGLGASVFSPFHAEMDENGVVHTVFNAPGIQLDTNGDTLSGFHSAVYWNSTDQQLVELNDPIFRSSSALTDSIDLYFPGSGWGMGYTHVATGPGGHVLAAWTQPELVDSVTLNYVFGEVGGVASVQRYSTDIYAAHSDDSGQTWSLPFKLIGTEGIIEQYPQLAELEVRDDSVHVGILYQWDTNPGQSITQGESDVSICPWIFKQLVIDPQYPVGIDDNRNVVPGEFELAQNYPNPFNPQTTIAFTLQKTQDITVDVFNITGQKIATLFKGRKNAGEHQITFDGKDVASGVYLYRLSNGVQSLTQKMVLLK